MLRTLICTSGSKSHVNPSSFKEVVTVPVPTPCPLQSAKGILTSTCPKCRPLGVPRISIRHVLEDPKGHPSLLVWCQGAKIFLIIDKKWSLYVSGPSGVGWVRAWPPDSSPHFKSLTSKLHSMLEYVTLHKCEVVACSHFGCGPTLMAH